MIVGDHAELPVPLGYADCLSSLGTPLRNEALVHHAHSSHQRADSPVNRKFEKPGTAEPTGQQKDPGADQLARCTAGLDQDRLFMVLDRQPVDEPRVCATAQVLLGAPPAPVVHDRDPGHPSCAQSLPSGEALLRRQHIEDEQLEPGDPLFLAETGGILAGPVLRRAWRSARKAVLPPHGTYARCVEGQLPDLKRRLEAAGDLPESPDTG
ncbi:hypothetical protein ABT040_26010 [Streptomyces sp. NPDC002688]|uniref:hypothetical protein n=1 Tax=Streptomyces sp. NPDC002688 TaxID=3154423 RepID=UPI0033284981